MTVVNLIDGLGGIVWKLSNKRSGISFWKKYDIVVSLNSENGTKVPQVSRDFDIPRRTLTTVPKNKVKIISHLFLSFLEFT